MDIELIIIEREALLKRKKLLDIIQKNRINSPLNRPVAIRCFDLTRAVGIHDWAPFSSLVQKLAEEGAYQYTIDDCSTLGR